MPGSIEPLIVTVFTDRPIAFRQEPGGRNLTTLDLLAQPLWLAVAGKSGETAAIVR